MANPRENHSGVPLDVNNMGYLRRPFEGGASPAPTRPAGRGYMGYLRCSAGARPSWPHLPSQLDGDNMDTTALGFAGRTVKASSLAATRQSRPAHAGAE